MGEKQTTAQIKPRHGVKTSPSTAVDALLWASWFRAPPPLERKQTQVLPLLDAGPGASRLGPVIYQRKRHER